MIEKNLPTHQTLSHRAATQRPKKKALSLIVLTLGITTMLSTARAEEEKQQSAASSQEQEIAQRIDQLSSPDFTVREEATRRLAEIGRPAIQPLQKALHQKDLEVSMRAVAVLEKIFLNHNDETGYRAEVVLDDLLTSKNHSAAQRAQTVLKTHYPIRRKRALVKIQKLGGTIQTMNERGDIQGNIKIQANDNAPLKGKRWLLRLGTSWKGGDEGLEHVKRLTDLNTLYLIDGSGVSEKGKAELQKALPNLTIQQRGRARLGIAMVPVNAEGCMVQKILPGSAADKGGIQRRDLITSFAGEKVTGPESLVKLIAKKKPGDKVQVEVKRNIQTVTLEVELKGWRAENSP